MLLPGHWGQHFTVHSCLADILHSFPREGALLWDNFNELGTRLVATNPQKVPIQQILICFREPVLIVCLLHSIFLFRISVLSNCYYFAAHEHQILHKGISFKWVNVWWNWKWLMQNLVNHNIVLVFLVLNHWSNLTFWSSRSKEIQLGID